MINISSGWAINYPSQNQDYLHQESSVVFLVKEKEFMIIRDHCEHKDDPDDHDYQDDHDADHDDHDANHDDQIIMDLDLRQF